MSHPLTWQVDSREGLIIVTVTGTVDARSGPGLHRALSRCLSGEPGAVVIDLAGASVPDPQAAQTFARILDEARPWPGTPVLLCTPEAPTADMIGAAVTEEPLLLYASVAEALSALTGYTDLISEAILPVPGAARQAREIVTEACARWDVPQLAAPATLVASELVTNAVVHARTAMTFQMTLRPRYLYLAVIDGSPAGPEPRGERRPDAIGGRGLHLVDMVTDRWAYHRNRDGKVVWARFGFAG